MIYHTISPPPELAGYVRFFWILESDSAYTHHSVADGCAELLFHYNGTFDELNPGNTSSSFVSGLHAQTQQPRKFTIKTGFGIFAAYLYPYALQVIFGIPACSLSNEMPDLITLLGQQGKDLQEQMISAPDNEKRKEILSRFLLYRIQQSSHPFSSMTASAVRQIMQHHGNLNMQKLAASHCISQRQFERTFKTFAGLTPKLFSRITRFQYATRFYSRPARSLTDIALESGYYDQSHFIHDFKKFAGYHPGAYFNQPTEAAAWR